MYPRRAFSSFAENIKRTRLLQVQVVPAFILRGGAFRIPDPLVSSKFSLQDDASDDTLDGVLNLSELACEGDDNLMDRARGSYGRGNDTEELKRVIARIPYAGNTLSTWSRITWANTG